MKFRKEPILGMTNLYPKRTHLPVVIWVDNLGSARKGKHNEPRIKVQNVKGDKAVDDTFSLSISKNPEILSGKRKLSNDDYKEIVKFVSDNYDVLMKHWNQEIDEDELKEIIYNRY